MIRYWFFFWLAFFTVACTQTGKVSVSAEAIGRDSICYANGFTIEYFTDYTVAEIKDPWDSTKLLQRYVLVDREIPLPATLPKGTLIRVPIRNVVVYTSVHASVIDQLGEAGNIIGVCEPQYMDTPSIREGLRSGKIADLGESMSPNVEKMIDIGAEVIIASPFQNSNYGQAEKIGIPIIEGADYMESHPLGRAEWNRFYGLLFDKSYVADSVFKGTETRYNNLKKLAAKAINRPTVFSERKYGAFWYISCGDSYVAQFFKDAGADYIFNYLPGAGSEPLTFETVYDKAVHADFWLMKYNLEHEMTFKDLRTEYNPYENFEAFKNQKIYTCNTRNVRYYEEFPIHPDRLLKDLIKIFHPDLLPDYNLSYYQLMK